WPQIAPFLGTIRDNAQMTQARYSHGTLRRPWTPGLVHIGDAAHRASPQLGQGANMALLDALALARQAWAADTAPAPRAWAALAGLQHAVLPLLGRALARQLQELPGANDGLSLTERLLLRVLASRGELPADRVFAQLMMQD
ncbi:FAD-dependent monooxygenase, partial [Cellulomonas iranensis]|uniref:FAD-dependent monooxygenase n=1 Tax=Cellulomonas iranensis TaxID=76862 RepID=UPI001C4EB389